jgi:hypothetical protein
MSEHTVHHTCPSCGYEMDTLANVVDGQDTAPHPGDVTICMDCTAPAVFRQDMSLRALTVQEVLDHPEIARYQLELALFRTDNKNHRERTDQQ